VITLQSMLKKMMRKQCNSVKKDFTNPCKIEFKIGDVVLA
jgi:hypothetical protein